MENPTNLSDEQLQEILERSHGATGDKILVLMEQDYRKKQRIEELEGDLQVAEAVGVRYQIDAVGYKAERDKLQKKYDAAKNDSDD